MANNGDPFYQEIDNEEFESKDSIMSLLGDPNYSNARILHPSSDLSRYDFK
jgi:hypothetical protein